MSDPTNIEEIVADILDQRTRPAARLMRLVDDDPEAARPGGHDEQKQRGVRLVELGDVDHALHAVRRAVEPREAVPGKKRCETCEQMITKHNQF